MNINKLVKWNLKQQMSKRIASADLQERVSVAGDIANVRSLHRKIHAEAAAVIASRPTWDDVD